MFPGKKRWLANFKDYSEYLRFTNDTSFDKKEMNIIPPSNPEKFPSILMLVQKEFQQKLFSELFKSFKVKICTADAQIISQHFPSSVLETNDTKQFKHAKEIDKLQSLSEKAQSLSLSVQNSIKIGQQNSNSSEALNPKKWKKWLVHFKNPSEYLEFKRDTGFINKSSKLKDLKDSLDPENFPSILVFTKKPFGRNSFTKLFEPFKVRVEIISDVNKIKDYFSLDNFDSSQEPPLKKLMKLEKLHKVLGKKMEEKIQSQEHRTKFFFQECFQTLSQNDGLLLSRILAMEQEFQAHQKQLIEKFDQIIFKFGIKQEEPSENAISEK